MPYKENYLRRMWDKSRKKFNSQTAITYIYDTGGKRMNEKKCRRWTQEEIDYVRMFAEDPDGDNCITVAMYLGRTASAVRGKVHQLRKEGTQTKLLDKWSDWEIKCFKKNEWENDCERTS